MASVARGCRYNRVLPILAYTKKTLRRLFFSINNCMKYCREPFIHSEINPKGDIRLCCGSWHPKIVGNIHQSPLEEIWTNKESQKVRESINDQSYKYCKLEICPQPFQSTPINVHTRLPKVLKFSFDNSCNLECPSCRSSKIQHVKGSKEYNESMSILNKVKESYYKFGVDQPTVFIITGSGDPFGSDVFRNFLYDFDGRKVPNLKFVFLTNGVMLTPKVINKISKIYNNIKQMNISIDSATPDTYNVVRKGGNFTQLQKNIEYLHNFKQFNHVKFCYSFVIQNTNFAEIEPFVEWILTYPRASVRFTRILNWSDMAIDFNKENIFSPDHPNYTKLQETLAKIKHIPNIDFHNVLSK